MKRENVEELDKKDRHHVQVFGGTLHQRLLFAVSVNQSVLIGVDFCTHVTINGISPGRSRGVIRAKIPLG